MFAVKVGSNEFICTRTVKLLSSKFLDVSDAECIVVVPLGVASDSKAVKTLKPMFEKALAVSEKRSENFIIEIQKQSAALEKMVASFNARPAAERTQKGYDSLIAFVKRENDQIATLWKRWCENQAKTIASDALEACVKSATDKGVKELAAAKKAAAGKVSQLPLFQIIGGVLAIAVAGTGPALALGAAKLSLALVDRLRSTQKALQLYSDEEKQVQRDIAAFREAVDALAARVARVDAHRTTLETMIIGNTQEAQEIRRKVAAMKTSASGSAGKDVAALEATLARTLANSQELTSQIIDPAPLQASLRVIAAEQLKMATHVKASTAKTDAATKDFLPLLKTVKETGDILKTLSEAA